MPVFENYLEKQIDLLEDGGDQPGASVPFGDNAVQGEGDWGGVSWAGPDDTAILAFRITGDAHDRFQVWADGTIFLGPGTQEPVAALGFNVGSGAIDQRLDGLWELGKGPIVRSPDGTMYRLKVANGGAVSSELVP